MIGWIVAVQLLTPTAQASVTYDDVPPEVTRVLVLDVRGQGRPRMIEAKTERTSGRVRIRAVPHRAIVVSAVRADGKYLLDGPFIWPATDVTRTLGRPWRRTLITPPAATSFRPGAMEWVDAEPVRQSVWPMCFVDDEGAGCWGVTDAQRGVAVGRGADGLVWTVVSADGEAVWRESKWGRLVIVHDRHAGREPPQIRFGRPVVPSSGRTAGVRLETRGVDAAFSVHVEPGVVWVAGLADAPADAWVEVTTARAGPSFLPLQALASGPTSLPATIVLPEPRVLVGVVVGARNEPANAALVTVFRLIDSEVPVTGDQRRKPRRVFAAETIASADGSFEVGALGDADYEAVAFHPQLGRASVIVGQSRADIRIRLKSPGLIRGRVVSGGKPAVNVEITSAPDPDAFRTADDPLDLKGGDARSGPDGRFVVMAAPSGGGELRIGGGRLPVKRVPLPRVPLPVLDLGDIDLGAPITFTVVLDQDTPCDIRATGPIGHSGLQVIMATRVGPGLFRVTLPEKGAWNFGLLCGREGRSLSPAVLPIGVEHAGKEVRLAIR